MAHLNTRRLGVAAEPEKNACGVINDWPVFVSFPGGGEKISVGLHTRLEALGSRAARIRG